MGDGKSKRCLMLAELELDTGHASASGDPHTVGNKTVQMFGSFGLCIEDIFD